MTGCDINNTTEAETSDISVGIIRPISWEEFQTSDVTVNLYVESTQTVDSIAVYVDGNLAHVFSEFPYETILQIEPLGTHNIYAVATDVIGGSATSELITFAINLPDIELPSGFITYPAEWSNISGDFEVRVTAIDNVGIETVELYIDGEYFDEILTTPYNFTVNSANWINGNHTIYAKIIDTSQNYSYTQLININIGN